MKPIMRLKFSILLLHWYCWHSDNKCCYKLSHIKWCLVMLWWNYQNSPINQKIAIPVKISWFCKPVTFTVKFTRKWTNNNATSTKGSVLDFFPYDAPPSALRFLESSTRGMLFITYTMIATSDIGTGVSQSMYSNSAPKIYEQTSDTLQNWRKWERITGCRIQNLQP